MNEELKIIIKAVTKPAEDALGKVKKELEDVGSAAKNTSGMIDKALSTMGKTVLVTVGAITALTGAMVALGKSSLEYRKIQAQLVSGFNAVGLSAAQANKTYKEMFGFLGEADRAAEASNLLAQLTQDEKELTEWTQILQGVYAKFPDSLPVETLAEAVNHTAQLGEVQGTLADALEWSGIKVETFNARLARTTSVAEREALIRNTLNGLYMNASRIYAQNNQALIQYNQSQAQLDQSLARATEYVIPLMTALNKLAATLLNILRPAFENIAATLVAFVQWILAAIEAIGAFFGIFSKGDENGVDTIGAAIGNITTGTEQLETGIDNVTGAFEDATEEAEKLKRSTMGFDELNIVSSPMSSKADTSAADQAQNAIEIPQLNIPTVSLDEFKIPGLEDFEDKVAKIKEYLTPIATAVGIIATGLALWKITDFVDDLLKMRKAINPDNFDDILEMFEGNSKKAYAYIDGYIDKHDALIHKLKTVGGELLAIVGVFTTIYGFSDAWVNGLDWGNMAIEMAGIAAAVAGVGLAFGKVPALITAAIGGITLAISSVKDFIDNGMELDNMIGILAASVTVGVAAFMAFGGVAGVIAGVVVGIGALTAAIILEKEAILSVEEAEQKHLEAIEAVMNAELSYTSAIDAADKALERLRVAEEAAGMSGEELYNQVKNGTLTYTEMTDAQKELYKAYIDNEKKQKDAKKALEDLEKARREEVKASYESQLALAKESDSYDEFKKSVVDAFEKGELSAEEARDLLEKAMSEMSTATQKTFMEDMPNAITEGMDPNRYETTRKKLGDWFEKAGEWISEKLWQPIKKGFEDGWNHFTEGMSNIANSIKEFWDEKLKPAIQSVWTKLKNWFTSTVKPIFTTSYWTNKFNSIKEGALSALNGLLSGVKSIVSQITSALSSIGSKVSSAASTVGGWVSSGISYVGSLIPKMATGGIVSGATVAMIGEAGREAVLPLENNTGWMDELADRIASRNSAPTKIVLKVGERELGWATINGINNITKQTGGLQLQLV